MTPRRSNTIFAALGLLALMFIAAVPGGAATHVPKNLFAQAQASVAAAVEALQDRIRGQIEKAALALEDLKAKIDAADRVDATLADLKLETDKVGAEIDGARTELQDRLSLVTKRLDELGAAPEEGQTEDDTVAQDRKRLQTEKGQINAILADGDALRAQAQDLSDHVTDLRRTLFAETVFRHTEINGELIDGAARAAATTWEKLIRVSSASLDFMWRFKREGLLIAFGATIAFAVIVAVMVRRLFGSLIHRDPALANPHYIHRLSVAFWSATIPALARAFILVCGLGLLFSFNVLREELFNILRSAAWAGLGVYYVFKLARAVVSPGKPQWRLIDVSADSARRLVAFAVVLAGINAVSYVLSVVNIELDAPLALTVVEGLIASFFTGVVLALLSFLTPMGGPAAKPSVQSRLWRVSLAGSGLFLILAPLFGYVGLARFVSSQIVVTGAILATMYVGFLSGHAISQHGAFARSALGQSLERRFTLDDIRLDQCGLVAGLVVYLGVLVLGLPLVMLTWGFTGADISAIFVRVFTEIRVGNINISLVGILVGLALFMVGLFGMRWIQRWLDGNVMARSHLDTGVRNSVNTVLGYAGVVLAAVIGISAAGFDLSSLALIAGALSLGVGFGLQTIVQNFVSGLILLAERPFKVGDWIVNGPVEGFVRRISVRATEIETFQNQSIIVPNSQLINASVGNWTLRNTLARSEIPVSVSYESDPRQVMNLLLEIARAHPLVLTVPEPNVGFQGFGQSSLDFELRFHLADIFQGGPVRNDIRVAIIERFRKEGIVMPFPQRDLNVRLSGTSAALTDALKSEGLADDVVRRIVERAEGTPAPHPRGRKVDLADDNDGSPFDGMHHALRDDDSDEDSDGADDANLNR